MTKPLPAATAARIASVKEILKGTCGKDSPAKSGPGLITEPGVYEMDEGRYHADPCPEPSLSRSCIRELITKSAQHVMFSHPRLTPQPTNESESKFDTGTASHALLLQGIDKAKIIDAADWKTKKSRDDRDEARAAGFLPFLPHQWDGVLAMVTAAKQQISACDELAVSDLCSDGKSEQTICWKEASGIWCRVRPDWWSNDRLVMMDYKTTGESANPEDFGRKVVSMGYDIQDQFYTRGADQVLGIVPKFIFVVQETNYPYICSFIALDPEFKEMGFRKMEAGMEIWERCIKAKKWPGYPRRVCHISAPGWELAKWGDA